MKNLESKPAATANDAIQLGQDTAAAPAAAAVSEPAKLTPDKPAAKPAAGLTPDKPKAADKAKPRTVKLVATPESRGGMVNPFTRARFTVGTATIVDDYIPGGWEDCQVQAGMLKIVEG